MKLIRGVNPQSLRSELLLALVVGNSIWEKFQRGSPNSPAIIEFQTLEFEVTSLNDRIHSRTSLHYDGKAADIRIKGLPDHLAAAFIKAWDAALGYNPDYDIVLESDHIHIEYQPKLKRGG